MNTRTALIASALLAASLISGTAHAVSVSGQGTWETTLQGRDLDGNAATFEAYYDTVLDITWLADANYAKTSGYNPSGGMDWSTATIWAANLSFTDGVNVYDNWRLPTVEPINGSTFNYIRSYDGSTDYGYNISEQGTDYAGSTSNEMAHLYYNTLNNKGGCDPALSTAESCSAQAGWGLKNTGPFTNIQGNLYWSGTKYSSSMSNVWLFYFHSGYQTVSDAGIGAFAMAVSPGDVTAVPEPETYAMMLAGLGLVGFMAQHRKLAKI